MGNVNEVLKSILQVLLAHQRQIDSLNRSVTAIRGGLDSTQDKRVENELLALVRAAQQAPESDSDLLNIERLLEDNR
jgi:hypothetical protein